MNGETVNVYVIVKIGENAAGRSIQFRTFNGPGVTGADPMDPWVRGYCGVSIYRAYKDGTVKKDERLKFSIRHEFAHVLGIGDYYATHNDSSFLSVTNAVDMKVSSKDIEMMLRTFSTGQWTEWP